MDEKAIGIVEFDETTFVFDGTFEGFLTIIHGHYYKQWRPNEIVTTAEFQQKLATNYKFIDTDFEQAKKVEHAIKTKIAKTTLETVYASFLFGDFATFLSLYKYVIFAFKIGRNIDDYKLETDVAAVLKSAHIIRREAHYLKEFTRFSETKSGIYYAEIAPKYNCLPLISNHFQDRFPSFGWIIHDIPRGNALIYNGKKCVLAQVGQDANMVFADKEEQYQQLWQKFHKTIAIKERKNYKLQRQNLALHRRYNMVEFEN